MTTNASTSKPRGLQCSLGPSALSADARARAVESRPGFGKRPKLARKCRSSSADIVHLVLGTQFLESAGKPGVDGAGRDPEQLPDRGRGVAEPVAQDDDHPSLQREAGDRVEQLPVAARNVVPLQALELGFAADQAPLGSEQVEAAIDDDPVQPRPEGAALVEAPQSRESPLERILGDIVRELPPACDDERGAPRRLPVAVEELGRRLPGAAARQLDELGVAAHAHDHILLRISAGFASRGPQTTKLTSLRGTTIAWRISLPSS